MMRHAILLVAHSPLASALKAVAAHAFPESVQIVEALDVAPDMSPADVEAHARSLLARIGRPQALILVDVFGATPFNGIETLADGVDVKLLTGVNVPMLWRALNHAGEPLDVMASRAESGGVMGVMQVAPSRPQYQTSKPGSHDHEHGNDQQ